MTPEGEERFEAWGGDKSKRESRMKFVDEGERGMVGRCRRFFVLATPDGPRLL